LIATAALAQGGAQEYLIAVFPHNWAERCQLVQAGMDPILNMDDYLLLKVTGGQLAKVAVRNNFQVLDSNPSQALYYLVQPEQTGELSRYGTVLFSHKKDYLLKVDPGKENQLWQSGWRLRWLGPAVTIEPYQEPKRTGFVLSKDTLISAMVDQVDSLNYIGYIRRLQNFKTRYALTDSCKKAAEYLRSLYEGFSLSPVFENFRAGFAPNVIATLPGVTEPQVQVIVCGHFDATNNHGDPTLVAPGADDNASGSSAALELARIFKGYQFERTLKFIDFAGEEQGLFGSMAYADSVAKNRDSIFAVFNLDMIAYVNGPESLQVIANAGSKWLADTLIAYTQTYVPELATNRAIGYYPYSDHAPFEDKGYPAILGIELSIERNTNPYYHSPGDTIGSGFNSLSFATRVIKAVATAAAGMAKPIGVAAAEETDQPNFSCPTVSVEPNLNQGRFSLVYSLPVEGKVTIELFNTAGERVGQVFNGRSGSGSHRLSFDARTLPSGVYFLTFKDNNYFITRRFTCVN
jgi:hypothetical protein